MWFSEVDSKNVSITSQSYLIVISFISLKVLSETTKDRINDT